MHPDTDTWVPASPHCKPCQKSVVPQWAGAEDGQSQAPCQASLCPCEAEELKLQHFLRAGPVES